MRENRSGHETHTTPNGTVGFEVPVPTTVSLCLCLSSTFFVFTVLFLVENRP